MERSDEQKFLREVREYVRLGPGKPTPAAAVECHRSIARLLAIIEEKDREIESYKRWYEVQKQTSMRPCPKCGRVPGVVKLAKVENGDCPRKASTNEERARELVDAQQCQETWLPTLRQRIAAALDEAEKRGMERAAQIAAMQIKDTEDASRVAYLIQNAAIEGK